MNVRRVKAEQIAKTNQVVKQDENTWLVPSQSGREPYLVAYRDDHLYCTCLDYEARQLPCKHIYAVQIVVLKWFDYKHKKAVQIHRPTYP